MWPNVDTITHRVVLDDLSINTGNLDRGAFSSPMLLGATGAYHCTIHHVMVRTIKRQYREGFNCHDSKPNGCSRCR